MVHMSASEFTEAQRATMLLMARGAIATLLAGQPPHVPATEAFPEWLRAHRACFVTLESHGHLRGCIGSLEAGRPLGVDIILNAISAVSIHLSILSVLSEVAVSSEAELLAMLRPDIDGVVFQAGTYRATFLPVVWHSLKTPAQFMSELKRKAGLSPNYWSDQVRIWRYHTESFGEASEVPVGATGMT
jgi:AMMECR1 domain-containing protein